MCITLSVGEFPDCLGNSILQAMRESIKSSKLDRTKEILMGREKDGYRDNIEQLNRLYPSHEALSVEEVAQVMNCSTKTVRRNLGHLMVDKRIMKTALARYMCG